MASIGMHCRFPFPGAICCVCVCVCACVCVFVRASEYVCVYVLVSMYVHLCIAFQDDMHITILRRLTCLFCSVNAQMKALYSKIIGAIVIRIQHADIVLFCVLFCRCI